MVEIVRLRVIKSKYRKDRYVQPTFHAILQDAEQRSREEERNYVQTLIDARIVKNYPITIPEEPRIVGSAKNDKQHAEGEPRPDCFVAEAHRGDNEITKKFDRQRPKRAIHCPRVSVVLKYSWQKISYFENAV